MKTWAKIACRTIGVAGMGLATYDVGRVANRVSKNTSAVEHAKFIENAYFDSRTIDSDSYLSNGIREGAFNLRLKDPVPSLWGRVKGYFKGAFNALGNNILIISSSALALLGKGIYAKIGAIGVGLSLAYDLIRNGFGVGKNHPMQ